MGFPIWGNGKMIMAAIDYSKVADLYDSYVQTNLDVAFFLQEAQGCRSVLELTSGTGRLSLPLIEAGVNLSCLDNSPQMLAVLRKKLHSKGLVVPVYEGDMCSFKLPHKFDLIIIPFNAFSEISDPLAQKAALQCIRSHLDDSGHLICTLHNPATRLKLVDGHFHFRGIFPLPENIGKLVLSSAENFDSHSSLVKGAQFYEIYNPEGILQSKCYTDIQFFIHYRETFETLIQSQGYKVHALYGNYDRAAFEPDKSPFMIWKLSKDSG